jgi:hypothetical protein
MPIKSFWRLFDTVVFGFNTPAQKKPNSRQSRSPSRGLTASSIFRIPAKVPNMSDILTLIDLDKV